MSSALTNRFVALGFIGAVVATLLGAAVSPDQPLGAISVFARATSYILVVFTTAAATTYLGLLLRSEGQRIRTRELAFRTAASTVWLPPLLMFSEQKSWFVSVIWAVLIIEVARLIAFVRGTLHDNAALLPQTPYDGHLFSVLKRDFPSGISILGALTIQGAIFGAVDGHAILAGLLYVVGTMAFAYRALQMFQDLPALNNSAVGRPVPEALFTATFLVVFAWLPYILSGGSGLGGNSAGTTAHGRLSIEASRANEAGAEKDKQPSQGTASAMARLRSLFLSGGSESRGNSFAIARRILDSTFAQPSDGASARVKTLQTSKIASAVDVVGPVFPGVELYPEEKPHPRLVARPRRQRHHSAFLAPIRSVFLLMECIGSGEAHRIGRHRIPWSCTEVRQRASSVLPTAMECPWKRGRTWDSWSIRNATAQSKSFSKTPTLFRIR
jgi:hypothetical protein